MRRILRKVLVFFINFFLTILWIGGISIALFVICLDVIRVYLFKRF